MTAQKTYQEMTKQEQREAFFAELNQSRLKSMREEVLRSLEVLKDIYQNMQMNPGETFESFDSEMSRIASYAGHLVKDATRFATYRDLNIEVRSFLEHCKDGNQ